jgi:D-glycero-alpha-D-manno-heptose 1-phosphate guanylyltransferase
VVNANLFESFDMPDAFSFETDFLEPFIDDLAVFAFECEGYFIDIGVPEDYNRAQDEIPALF